MDMGYGRLARSALLATIAAAFSLPGYACSSSCLEESASEATQAENPAADADSLPCHRNSGSSKKAPSEPAHDKSPCAGVAACCLLVLPSPVASSRPADLVSFQEQSFRGRPLSAPPFAPFEPPKSVAS